MIVYQKVELQKHYIFSVVPMLPLVHGISALATGHWMRMEMKLRCMEVIGAEGVAGRIGKATSNSQMAW
jgi:hypothetical protein